MMQLGPRTRTAPRAGSMMRRGGGQPVSAAIEDGRGGPPPPLGQGVPPPDGASLQPKYRVCKSRTYPELDNMKSCIYAMRHIQTRKYYIGSSIDFRRRKALWKRKFEEGDVPATVRAVSPDFNEWEFVPIEEIPSNTLPTNRLHIEDRERLVIDLCREMHPDRVLNATRITTRPLGPGVVRDYGTMSHQTYYRRRREGQSHEEALLATNRSKKIKGL